METVHDMEILETNRLRLRKPDFGDREAVWSAAHHEANITKGMLWDPPQTMEELDGFTRDSLDGWTRGDSLVWTIEEKDTHEFLGRIALRKKEEKRAWYVGFWIHPHHHGRGFVTEAARAVIAAAFERLHAPAIVSSHAEWNVASGKVMAKLGMRRVGHNPVGFVKHGKSVPEEEYELTYDEWMRTKLDGAADRI